MHVYRDGELVLKWDLENDRAMSGRPTRRILKLIEQLVVGSTLSKREIIRRLGTSASQFYRLLDQTNYSKSVGQLLALLHVLDCDVDLVVRKR